MYFFIFAVVVAIDADSLSSCFLRRIVEFFFDVMYCSSVFSFIVQSTEFTISITCLNLLFTIPCMFRLACCEMFFSVYVPNILLSNEP